MRTLTPVMNKGTIALPNFRTCKLETSIEYLYGNQNDHDLRTSINKKTINRTKI